MTLGENLDTTTNAPMYCYNLKIDGLEDKVGQWYLPAAGELYSYLYMNLSKIKETLTLLSISSFLGWQWSSSETNIYLVWHVDTTTGKIGSRGNTNNYPTSCFLAINKSL